MFYMEYITVQEAAKKMEDFRPAGAEILRGRPDRWDPQIWKIVGNSVQRGETTGPAKGKGAPVFQHSRPQPEVFPGFMPLMNTPFEPGRCLDYINEMEAGPIKEIALAEYHYFSGQPEKAALEMRADRYPIPAIYLHLAAAMDYMSLKQTQQVQKHLLAAWESAAPTT